MSAVAQQKLYAGAKLREMRTRLSLTQKEFAAKLGVSLPYLNQMENNNRPVFYHCGSGAGAGVWSGRDGAVDR